MKKLISTFFALALVIPTAHNAQAAQISTSGYFMITGEALHNQRLLTQDTDTTLRISERVELALDMNMGENVTGQLSMRIPANDSFGEKMNGAYTVETELRSAYIDFPIAMLDIRAGLQGFSLPSYLGSGVNPIMDDIFAGFAINADFGTISPELAWFVTSTGVSKSNSYALTVAIKPNDTIAITPWFTLDDLSNMGEGSNMYMGATLEMAINDISLGAGAIYTKKDSKIDHSALLVEGHISFALSYLTPGLAVWYGTQGDAPMGITEWGSWGAFNGSADSYYENGNGLLDVFPVNYNDPFNSTGIYLSVSDIAIIDSISLAGHALYVLDNTLNSNESELELGANIYTSITNNLDFIVDAYYFIPMYSTKTGNGALVACTLQANF